MKCRSQYAYLNSVWMNSNFQHTITKNNTFYSAIAGIWKTTGTVPTSQAPITVIQAVWKFCKNCSTGIHRSFCAQSAYCLCFFNLNMLITKSKLWFGQRWMSLCASLVEHCCDICPTLHFSRHLDLSQTLTHHHKNTKSRASSRKVVQIAGSEHPWPKRPAKLNKSGYWHSV